MRFAVKAGGLVLCGAALVAQACATGKTEFDDGTGGTVATGGAATTTSSQLGGEGGTTSSSSTELPCGIDCATIQTDDCHEAVCNMTSKQCEVIAATDGTSCEDGLFCTVNDTCQVGTCTGGSQNDCGEQPGDCDDIVCTESSKSCSTIPKQNGASCTSTDLCIINSTCSAGVCVGAPKDCFFAPVPNACYSAVCNSVNGMCEPKPDPLKNGDACVDANLPCTVNMTCNNGMCEGGQPKDCSGLTQGCNIGVCDMMTGQCTTQQVMQGQPCDDLDFCTTGETCNAGNCTNGTPINTCSGQTEDKCCPANCTDQNDKDCEVLGMVFLTSSNGTAGFYRYTIATDTWATVKSPSNTTKSQITNDGTYVYLLGTNNQIYKYDPKGDNWSAHIAGPTASASSPIGLLQWFKDGFYYCKDGSTTMYVYRNNAWTNFTLPASCSCAGTWDDAANELYVRIYSRLGFMVVDTTNDAVVRNFADSSGVTENSRTGAYHSGYFYTRTYSGAFQKLDKTSGVKTATSITPISSHTATDTDFFTGLIYVSGYSGQATAFQVFDPGANTLVSKANQPSVSNHSTITVMR